MVNRNKLKLSAAEFQLEKMFTKSTSIGTTLGIWRGSGEIIPPYDSSSFFIKIFE